MILNQLLLEKALLEPDGQAKQRLNIVVNFNFKDFENNYETVQIIDDDERRRTRIN